MPCRIRVFPPMLSVLALAAAAHPQALQIVGQVPLPGDPIGSEIAFFFNEPLAKMSGDPFTLDPPLDGEFRVGGNHVVFRPAAIPGETRVRLTFAPQLRGESGATLPDARREAAFGTSPFQPLRARVREERGDRARIGFDLPYPVRAEALARHFDVVDYTGARVEAALENPADGAAFEAWVPASAPWPLRVRLRAGLTDDSGALVVARDTEAPCPDLPPLGVTRLEWGRFTPESQAIVIGFSQNVAGQALRANLMITELATGALLPFDLSPQGAASTHVATFRLAQPERARVSIALRAELVSDARTRLAETHNATLEREQVAFDVTHLWWYGAGRDGAALVVGTTKPLREFAPVETLRAHLRIDPPVENLQPEYREYGGDLVLKADWNTGQTYTVTFLPGLPLDVGQVLEDAVERVVVAESPGAYGGFAHEGRFYFPRLGGLQLALETRNVTQAELGVHRVFPDNLPAALGDVYNNEPGWEFVERQAEELSRETLRIAAPKDRLARTPLALDRLLPEDRRGVFVVRATPVEDSPDPWWSQAQKLVVQTRIGLLAHWQDDHLALFAHDLYTLGAVEGARVRVYSAKRQAIAEGRTDARGAVLLRGFEARLGVPRLVVVETDDDYAFLELERRNDDLTAMDRATDPYPGSAPEAFVYADRDLYRPGETVRLHWIARTADGRALAGAPLELKVLKPNGEELARASVACGPHGGAGHDLPTDRAYPTGRYEAQIHVPGGNAPIGSYGFRVEDFVPNRMKAEVSLPDARWQAGGEQEVRVNAQHLFGAPAGDRKVSAWVVYQRARGLFPGWEGYRFDNDGAFTPGRTPIGEARTDAAGDAAFTHTVAAPAGASFPLKAHVFAEVFELGGRSVLGRAEAVMLPSSVALGVAADTDRGPTAVTVHAAAVAADGAPAPLGEVRVTLEKQSWSYHVRRYYSNLEPNWSPRFEAVEVRTVPLEAGRGSTVFDVRDWGYYRVRVDSPETPQFSTTTLFSYGGTVEVADSGRPSLVKLSLDRERYAPGDTARLRIESPFDGRALVVVQGAGLQSQHAVDIVEKAGMLELPVGAEHFPNAWIEVTAMGRVAEGEALVRPYASFALISLPVSDPARALRVAIEDLPERIGPAATHRVRVAVRAADGSPVSGEITLAAVDEGIHGITDYRDPDPVGWFARARRADVRRAHFYDKVVFDFERASPGGDLAAQLARRVVPPLENWIRPVALWSGPVALDADGNAEVAIDVPEFTGQLRLVAVAASPGASGAARANVFVRRDHMIRTGMPRFMLPGDTAQCHATVHNHTDAACVAEVRWEARGALEVASGAETLQVPARGEAGMVAAIAAGNAAGAGTLRWEAVFKDAAGNTLARLEEIADLPVNPPAAYQSAHTFHVVAPGGRIALENTAFTEGAGLELEVAVSAHPAWRLRRALREVALYPHGCLEQTVSRCFPLFALRQSELLLGAGLGGPAELDSRLRTGIARIFAMQTPDGGLASWPGGGASYDYGSVYALHFLTLVKADRTLVLPAAPMAKLQRFARGLLERGDDSPSGLFLKAYALYALALDGDLDAIMQISRFDHVQMPTHGRHLLAAALALQTGDHARAARHLEDMPRAPHDAVERGGTLNSRARNLAIELIARIQIDGGLAGAHEPARELIEFLAQPGGATTQEQAFVITALAAYLTVLGGDLSAASATVTGPGVARGVSGADALRELVSAPAAPVVVENTGAAAVFVDATWRGVPREAATEAVARGLGITRRFFTMGGAPNEDNFFRQGDAYVVEIALAADQAVENAVVVAPLPGGLEVLNPRLQPDALPSALQPGGLTPAHLEIRDDRVVYAFDLVPAGTHRLQFVVQAVTPGRWTLPGWIAECMYDGSIRGATADAAAQVSAAR